MFGQHVPGVIFLAFVIGGLVVNRPITESLVAWLRPGWVRRHLAEHDWTNEDARAYHRLHMGLTLAVAATQTLHLAAATAVILTLPVTSPTACSSCSHSPPTSRSWSSRSAGSDDSSCTTRSLIRDRDTKNSAAAAAGHPLSRVTLSVPGMQNPRGTNLFRGYTHMLRKQGGGGPPQPGPPQPGPPRPGILRTGGGIS
jgi:hypothetical protein